LFSRGLQHRRVDDRPDERGDERWKVSRGFGKLDDDSTVILSPESQLGPFLARDPGIKAK
jgi:hypothetical protein